MARSRRRTPTVGMTRSAGEKRDRRSADRNSRWTLRRALKRDLASDGTVPPLLRDVSHAWCMAKDGRRWIGRRFPELMRK